MILKFVWQVTNSWPKTCFNRFSRWRRLHLIYPKIYYLFYDIL